MTESGANILIGFVGLAVLGAAALIASRIGVRSANKYRKYRHEHYDGIEKPQEDGEHEIGGEG